VLSFSILKWILSVCVVVATLPTAQAAEPQKSTKGTQVAAARSNLDSSFDTFCGEWGKKLHEREVHNIASIKWDSGTSWVQGTYVGYSEPLSCAVEPDSGTVPVGKIIYHEFVYEKRGPSIKAAEGEPGQAVETTEVTEIFRYQNGKWVY
jgi:hypothetical protein